MKKPILYFIAGMFLSLSVFAFWAFKSKTEEKGSYAVVTLSGSFEIVYEDGRKDVIKFQSKKTMAENLAAIMNQMDISGYNLTSNFATSSLYTFIFKKK